MIYSIRIDMDTGEIYESQEEYADCHYDDGDDEFDYDQYYNYVEVTSPASPRQARAFLLENLTKMTNELNTALARLNVHTNG